MNQDASRSNSHGRKEIQPRGGGHAGQGELAHGHVLCDLSTDFPAYQAEKGQHRLRGQIGAILSSSASQDLHARVLGQGGGVRRLHFHGRWQTGVDAPGSGGGISLSGIHEDHEGRGRPFRGSQTAEPVHRTADRRPRR